MGQGGHHRRLETFTHRVPVFDSPQVAHHGERLHGWNAGPLAALLCCCLGGGGSGGGHACVGIDAFDWVRVWPIDRPASQVSRSIDGSVSQQISSIDRSGPQRHIHTTQRHWVCSPPRASISTSAAPAKGRSSSTRRRGSSSRQCWQLLAILLAVPAAAIVCVTGSGPAVCWVVGCRSIVVCVSERV